MPIRHPDDPPPPPGSHWIVPVILILITLGVLSPFAVSYYRNYQLASAERETVERVRRFALAQSDFFTREKRYATAFSELGGEWVEVRGMDEKNATTIDGYRFRILTSQSASAPGGAKSFLDATGKLTGGFALLAAPAKYGYTGKGTFLYLGAPPTLYREDFDVRSDQITRSMHEFIVPPHAFVIP